MPVCDRLYRHLHSLFSSSLILAVCISTAQAQESIIVLKNGLTIGPGARGTISGVDQAAFSANTVNGQISAKPVMIVDDNLRATFFRNALVQSISDRAEPLKVITTGNADIRISGNHPRVAAVQNAIGVTPFDDYGRRIYSLVTNDGPLEILQGITEISSNYIRVEALESERQTIWDMRLALSSVPPDQLKKILMNHLDLNIAQNWLDIASVYWQARRYREAREILQTAIAKNPELENLRPQLKQLDELNADLMFQEVESRYDAGQYELAKSLLSGFDRSIVSIETQVKIDRQLAKYSAQDERIKQIKDELKKLVAGVTDEAIKETVTNIATEIERDINYSNLYRFADYQLLPDDTADERVLAVLCSGWLLGSGETINTLPLVASLTQSRELITQYLQQPDAASGQLIVERLRKIEGGTTAFIAKLAKLMRPPLPLPNTESTPGRYDVEYSIDAIPGRPTGRYTVQLPPEYDPNRKYPCVVTLHGEFSTSTDQLLWWTGPYNEQWKRCMGEASRHGYVIISPDWSTPKQPYYDYTENEHARVLAAMRDASRRINIDSDRIFISGHHMGGDAAWDIALAHPDLWAGMIPIGADCERFAVIYYENAKYVPMYFVQGELDGAPSPMARNGKYFDRFLRSAQYDCMLVSYKGRGRDHFQEELPRIIDWMNLSGHKRNAAQKDFKVVTARGGDNFFWFLELKNIYPSQLIHPLQFELRKGAAEVEGALLQPNANAVRIRNVPAEGYRLWLSPEQVAIDQDILVYDGSRIKSIKPELDIVTILEDLRRRGDRQHPFWLKADF